MRPAEAAKAQTATGHPLDPSIVRIRATSGDAVVGAGFLATADHVATCSHVVATALGLTSEVHDGPRAEIHLDFPFLGGARATATVAAWEPARATENGDIAVLKLTGPLPAGARPAQLASSHGTANLDFEVYGFPSGADWGRWTYGVVRDRLAEGWVQVEGKGGHGYRVQPGVSGAPVWVTGRGVIGMIVGADRDEATRVGFLIPSELIELTCPALRMGEPVRAEFAGLLEGLATLPRAAANGFELFMREYVGRPGEPVPFGGREDSLGALDAWLRDPETPYALLVAPAGRGKSALLARWCTDAASDGRADVAFVPVSIRFGTASEAHAVGLIGARLRHLTGRGGALPTSPQAWLDEIQATLVDDHPNGRPLLIVLDGVDEATGWDITDELTFPDEPGRGVKVVVSARELAARDADHWRRMLHWDWPGRAASVPLEPLDRQGIAMVLRSLGAAPAALAERADVVGELLRLSEGDPLLVRLYADALRNADDRVALLDAKALPKVPAGLKGFFELWWDDQERQWGDQRPQREPRAWVMLSVLATALGPVLIDDVLGVARDVLPDPHAVYEAVAALERFVVGDGREHGWVFSHPSLGQYFRDVLGKAEAGRWTERLVDYTGEVAESLLNGRLSPKEAPAYAVQWFGSHLWLAQAPLERFDALATPQWLKAWEALEGAEDGFLGDLRNAQRRADRLLLDDPDGAQRASAVPRQCRFALVASSITSLAKNVPPSLLAALVRERLWTPEHALAYVRRMPDDEARVSAVAGLSGELPDALLADALEMVRVVSDPRVRIQGLVAIVPRLPKSLLSETLSFVDSLEAEQDKVIAVVRLAPHLGDDLLAGAISRCRTLSRRSAAAIAKAALAVRLEPPEHEEMLAEALSDARESPDAYDRSRALAAVARLLKPPHDHAAWEEFLAAVERISSDSERSWILIEEASYLPDALVGRIPTIMRSFADPMAGDHVISAFAGRLPETDARQMLEVIGNRAGSGDRESGLAAFASITSPTLVRDALAMARATPEAFNFTRSVGALSARLAALGFPDEALAEVLAVPPTAYSQPDAMAGLAPELPPPLLDAAVDAALGFDADKDSVSQSSVLARLAARLAETGRGEDAVARARAIERAFSRLDAVRDIAPYIDGAVLEDAVSIALEPCDDRERDSALAALSVRLLANGQPERALDLIGAIEERDGRLRTLDKVASALPRDLLPRAEIATHLLSDQLGRVHTIALLLRQVAVEDRAELYAAALELALTVPGSLEQLNLLEELMPTAPPESVDDTIRAARAINHDLWRRIALTAFLPRLMELDAFDIALDIARETQSVASLVELVPPGSRGDLLREAAQEARSSRSEFDRVQELARLSTLADAHDAEDLLAEALDAARAFAATGWPWALIAVLEQLGPEHRGALFEEALRGVRGLERANTDVDTEMRVRGLVDLALLAPGDEGVRLASEAVDTVAEISDESNRSRVLGLIAPQLPPAVLDRVSEVADGFRDSLWLRQAIRGFLPALAAAGRAEEALERTLAAPTGRVEADVLAAIGAYLPEHLLDRALSATDAIPRYDRGKALVGLGPRLAAVGQPIKALELVVTISWAESRAAALGAVAPALASVPLAELASAWSRGLRTLAARDRSELLADIGALAPVIAAVGGAEAARATAAAVMDVGGWFP